MATFTEQAQEVLRQAGGRMTAQRRMIIDLLARTDVQFDAETFYDQAREVDRSVSLATVYRTLNTLADAGMLQRRYISPEHNRQYFERVPDDTVYFFTCRVCHRTFPVRLPAIKQLKTELAQAYGIEVSNLCMCMDGICPECRAAGTKEEKS